MNTETLIIKARGIWTGMPEQQSKLITPGAVAVKGSQIVGVGSPTEIIGQISSPAQIINLNELYLLPGLINVHAHLTMNAGSDPFSDYIARNDYELLLRAIINARIMLFSGVTTVRDCGSRGYFLCIMKNVDAQHLALPHILVSGPPVTRSGGHLYWMGGSADGAGSIRRAIRTRKKKGVDFIKLIVTGGQLTPGTCPELPAYTFTELYAAVEEAHRLGMSVSAHCLCAAGIISAVKAGVDFVDHAAFFVRDEAGRLIRKWDPEAAETLASSGVYVVPGLSAGYHRLDSIRSKTQRSPEDLFRLDQEKLMFEHFAKLVDMGVPMLVGTDAGVTLTPFNETFLELILMTRNGLSIEKALLAATHYAARALGLGGRKGVIQPGADADIIACAENPLQNIYALANIVWVMREGKVVFDKRKGGSLNEANLFYT